MSPNKKKIKTNNVPLNIISCITLNISKTKKQKTKPNKIILKIKIFEQKKLLLNEKIVKNLSEETNWEHKLHRQFYN